MQDRHRSKEHLKINKNHRPKVPSVQKQKVQVGEKKPIAHEILTIGKKTSSKTYSKHNPKSNKNSLFNSLEELPLKNF